MKYCVFVVWMLMGSLVFAGDSENPCKKEDKSAYLQKELGLTDKQKEQVKLLHDKYSSLVETRKKEMKALNEELVAQVQSPEKGPAVKAALLEKFKKYQAARNAVYLTRFEMALEIRELLTEEQIKKYKAFYHIKGKDEMKDKIEVDTNQK